ncbi:MAG: methyl-accepting chemotaxis protein [Rhizomicrobium sp.]
MAGFTLFRNLSVRTKVVLTFAWTLFATVVFGLIAAYGLSLVNDHAQIMRDTYLPTLRMLDQFSNRSLQLRQHQAVYLLSANDAQRMSEADTIGSLETEAAEFERKLQSSINPGTERQIADRWMDEWRQYLSLQDALFQTARTKGQGAAFALYNGSYKTLFENFRRDVDAHLAYNADHGTAEGDAGRATFEITRIFIFVALGGATVLCFGVGAALIYSVSKPLGALIGSVTELASGNLAVEVPETDREDEIGKLAGVVAAFKDHLSGVERTKKEEAARLERIKAEQAATIVGSIGAGLEALARGDLAHRITAELAGTFAKLKDDFNAAVSRLQDTMKNVLGGTNEISTGASEISQAADNLSRRTEQQAASLETTTAALEEITVTVKNTAQHANEASAIVTTAKAAAEDGGRVVEAAIGAMGQIEQSSKQITDIIGVIDEIAFQTNLLALNAGVEAARAGDAGKGFAVVASEVRALAGRSSNAAKEIKSLIKASGEHVDSGVRLVGESGEALKRIVNQVSEIDTLVSQMSLAAQQQATGIGEVNAAVAKMDQVTQQNTAMVEQSTCAARNLASETAELVQLVSFFRVGTQAPSARRAAAVPVKPREAETHTRTTQMRRVQPRRGNVALADKNAVPAEDWQEF